ncbi:hypothetical protein SLEP1_g46158 [Rubroshorea leprosula]|uniref:Uncharacterized protein n=1 Tax=Rubroshorea leprosula TaxID=152421 RepID=A0AAV5LLZ0_9ROSI|nr:hypothetical protein SLEP1_g46158 [Rubroshorea leprosula]
MFSEWTMSVVGSEVMPLDYGSMDSESSPSPTSSERTVEERREQRVVEEDEDEIPSNILEAGSSVDGCYDPDLEIVSEVRGYVTELGSRGSLRGIVGNCNLPHHVLLRPARAGGKGEKRWYYFGLRSSSKDNRSLFSIGLSSIKGWKEKFFFVDDTEWSRRDARVEQLSAWKAKKTKQNNYKLNEDEVEEVEKLVREEGDVVDILYLTSLKAIEAAELYGPSSLSEAEMNEFINAAGGLCIPKKPRKKLKTSTAAEKGLAERERLSSTSARALEVQPRPEPVMGGSEDVSEKVAPLQRKKRGVAKPEARGDEVVEFVPRPSPLEIDPEVWEREEAEVRGPGKGKGPFSQPSFQKSLFEATNTTGAKRFLNATLLEKEREELQKEKEDWEREKGEMQRRLDEVLPSVTELQNDNDVLSMKLALEECKRKICEEKLKPQDKYIDNMRKGATELKKNMNLLVHNGMEEHIGNFLNSSTFENILKLYGLPTAIVAFTDCRKKVKAQYPEVDVTTITFGEQEEGVEEDGESLFADFRPLIKLRWEHDAEGRTIFPPAFDAELVAVEEGEEEEEEARGAEAEDQAYLPEVQPPEVHQVSSDEVQQLGPPEVEVPPLPTGDESPPPPLPAKE